STYKTIKKLSCKARDEAEPEEKERVEIIFLLHSCMESSSSLVQPRYHRPNPEGGQLDPCTSGFHGIFRRRSKHSGVKEGGEGWAPLGSDQATTVTTHRRNFINEGNDTGERRSDFVVIHILLIQSFVPHWTHHSNDFVGTLWRKECVKISDESLKILRELEQASQIVTDTHPEIAFDLEDWSLGSNW
ncbi:hypothetical protein SCHPADRAFT_896932, partial [Schizopora paradoxa]